jgi:hypothetical protein
MLNQVVLGSVQETTGFEPVEAHFLPTIENEAPLAESQGSL